jgi:hypothetical protein
MNKVTTWVREAVVAVVAVALLGSIVAGCSREGPKLTELQRIKSGVLDVVLLSPRDALRHGKDDFVIEFRAADGKLVDVGDVRSTASMPMSGMPMFGSVNTQRTDTPGRYRAESDLSMAGTWRLGTEWNGPAGKGAVTFSGTVQ